MHGVEAIKMNAKISALAGKYQAGLKAHLKNGSESSLKQADNLGKRAVLLGLETLAVAKMHKIALAAVLPPVVTHSQQIIFAKRAQEFFIEFIVPIESTHSAATNANSLWNEAQVRLNQRTGELALSKRDVKRRIAQRKLAEQTLAEQKDRYAQLLNESHSLQDRLRQLVRRVLHVRENNCSELSRQLHDEIAQLLLGIDVRLLALVKKRTKEARILLLEVANTQSLIEQSLQQMKRVALELLVPHEK